MKIYSKEDFSYVVSSITGFTDQVGGELLAKALVGATTPKYTNVRLGIKGTQALNLLDSSPSFQAGACGWSASGTTTFSQRNITTCDERLNESLCYKDLYDTYQSMLMNPGQTSETVPFESQIADLKVKQIQQRIEQKLWTATVSGGDCFDGFKTLIASGQTGVAVSASGTTFSASAAYGTNGNPITEVDKLINALDDNAQAREDLVVFMSFANFRLYVQALTRANFFQNYIGGTNQIGGPASYEALHPNSNVKVVPTIGLAASNAVTIGPAQYMVVGFDLLSDHEKLDMWYSRDNDELRIRANYNYGAQIAKFGSTAYFAVNGLS
jgi:hypothetical protein